LAVGFCDAFSAPSLASGEDDLSSGGGDASLDLFFSETSGSSSENPELSLDRLSSIWSSVLTFDLKEVFVSSILPG